MVVATVTGNSLVGASVVVDQLLAEPFSAESSTEQVAAPELTQVLRKLVARAGVNGSDVIVGVGRSNVEVRSLQLPQADTNDLPDMVRFTAMRLFATVGDSWPIDFVTLPQNQMPVVESGENAETKPGATPASAKENTQPASIPPSSQIEVLAVAINPATVSQIRRVCSDAGLNLVQLGLRPMASGTLATLGTYSPIGSQSNVLLIDILTDEAEMVVLEQGHVTFMRSVRLAQSESSLVNALSAAEIRRTLIAAVHARSGLKIDKIILWTNPTKAEATIAEWKKVIQLPVEAIDPLSVVSVSTKSTFDTTDDAGTFAPLIGLTLQRRSAPQAISPPTVIDFLHPRQRVEAKKPIRAYALAGTAAALLVLGSLWWYRSSHQALDSEIESLTMRLKSMEDTLKLAQASSANWKKVERFIAGDIQWLDQLVYLSDKSLPADQMVMGDTTISLDNVTNSGLIVSRVAMTEQELEPKLEQGLRDKFHQVGAKGLNKSLDPNTPYKWTVEPEIVVPPSVVVDPTTLPPGQPVTKSKKQKQDDKAASEASTSNQSITAETPSANPSTENSPKTESKTSETQTAEPSKSESSTDSTPSPQTKTNNSEGTSEKPAGPSPASESANSTTTPATTTPAATTPAATPAESKPDAPPTAEPVTPATTTEGSK